MQHEEQLDSGTIERLEKQSDLLLRMYRAELAKNPMRIPLLINSATNFCTSARVRRLGVDNSVFAVIRTLQHTPRDSNRWVGQTLTIHQCWCNSVRPSRARNRARGLATPSADKLPADAIVVAWVYAVLLLLLVTGSLQVDGLHCFGSGSFSKWPLALRCVIATLLVGNRQFAAFTLA
jgi:hypothetical protein